MWEDIFTKTSGWFPNKVAESYIQQSETCHLSLIKTQLTNRRMFL